MIDHAEFARQFESLSVVMLRKAAAGRVPNYRKMRKPELVDALALRAFTDAQHEAAAKATEKPAKTRKAKTQSRTQTKATSAAGGTEKATKPAYKSTKAPTLRVAKRCQVCDKRPIDRKTAGKDSTLCGPCFEYAGWENTHSDNGHEGQGDLPSAPQELLEEMAVCPVCQGDDPADKPVKANGSKPGRKVSKPVARKPGQSKGEKFAEIAKANGWKPRRELTENGHLETVTAHAAGGEWVQIQWRDGSCLNTGTTHRGTDGKVRKVRNASAARQILESA